MPLAPAAAPAQPSSPPPAPSSDETLPAVVLDTNVVLDLLVFADARAVPLRQALDAGRLRWLATEPMLAELADVLGRPFLARWSADAAAVLASARARCEVVEPPLPPPAAPPRCADPDDQKFIDLAWCWPAAWLLSRDRALLDLARPARQRGVAVVTPQQWAAAPQVEPAQA